MTREGNSTKFGFWQILSLGLTAITVCIALIGLGVINPKSEIKKTAPAAQVTATDPDPINGVATGDSYVLVIYTMSGTPDTGLLHRHNARLEAMGYKMDPNTFRVSEGNSQCVMHAVYHKIK